MSKMDERIIVVERATLFDNEKDAFQGVLTDNDKLDEISKRFDYFAVIRRGDAENDPTYKQPIPYVVVRRGNEIFAYKRLSGGGETRLFDKISIGVGGHMNKEDGLVTFSENVVENMIRELEEELEIDAASVELSTLGLINDDSNEVGKVHIGILVVADIQNEDNVSVRETDQLEGEWMTIEKLNQPDVYSKLEEWSKLALKAVSLEGGINAN
jgi:predicted NUDIX family phosphoesterase